MPSNQTPPKKIRIGIIGVSPDRGWAATAHIPALQSLHEDFTIAALSTTRRASADAAAKAFGVPLAFDNHHDLVNCPEVDVVVVAVKVPHHLELVSAALEAGKAVYCEWPLGNGLAEAETLAALARKNQVLAVTGLQARFAPPIAYARELIEQGYLGQVLSTSVIGSGMGWGASVSPADAYTFDKDTGATMLTIPFAHTLDALCHLLGEARELSATTAISRPAFTVTGSDEVHTKTADDQVAVTGLLGSGAAFSLHYRGGRSRGANLLWEINGSDGDLQFTADGGHTQIFAMTLRGGRGAQAALEVLEVPAHLHWSPLSGTGPAVNVAESYARFACDYREARIFAPRSTTPSCATACSP